jgi:hypothetical protein
MKVYCRYTSLLTAVRVETWRIKGSWHILTHSSCRLRKRTGNFSVRETAVCNRVIQNGNRWAAFVEVWDRYAVFVAVFRLLFPHPWELIFVLFSCLCLMLLALIVPLLCQAARGEEQQERELRELGGGGKFRVPWFPLRCRYAIRTNSEEGKKLCCPPSIATNASKILYKMTVELRCPFKLQEGVDVTLFFIAD